MKLQLVKIDGEVGVILPDDVVLKNGFKEGDILEIAFKVSDGSEAKVNVAKFQHTDENNDL